MRGIIRSVTITFAEKVASFSSASCPSAAVSTLNPHAEIIAAKAARCDSSSSTISTLIAWRV